MTSQINNFGISNRQFKKLITLKNIMPVRYRMSSYGEKKKIPFDFPMPDDNDAFIARKVLVIDNLYITGVDPSGNTIEFLYSSFSKQRLEELQKNLNALNENLKNVSNQAVGEIMNEKEHAIKLLEQYEKGFSIGLAYKRMFKRYLLSGILFALILYFAIYFKHEPLLWIGVGLYIGMFLRDFGWLKNIKKLWSFSEKITDWDKVKEIAEK